MKGWIWLVDNIPQWRPLLIIVGSGKSSPPSPSSSAAARAWRRAGFNFCAGIDPIVLRSRGHRSGENQFQFPGGTVDNNLMCHRKSFKHAGNNMQHARQPVTDRQKVEGRWKWFSQKYTSVELEARLFGAGGRSEKVCFWAVNLLATKATSDIDSWGWARDNEWNQI